MRVKKKNTSGNARNFITRTQAVKKLQVSLADFRRLCIFKGIYPREPRNKKKANKGSTAPTTFYYYKDIQYLMHEPVLAKFREHKTFAKKLTKALGRGQVSAAKKLEENRNPYKLDHIIKERYPSFPDAIRDIDDALNMIFLFSNLPATDKVSARVIRDAQAISNQWMAYVAKERLLRKVFVSIKGVYYQADIRGEEVRWVVPFKFPENIPRDIDFRIMLTFLEFYSTLLHFVLYKLYTDSGLVYPPKIDEKKDKIISGLASYILESQDSATSLTRAQPTTADPNAAAKTLDSKTLNAALKTDSKEAQDDQNDDVDENETADLDKFEDHNKNKGDVLEQPSQFDSPVATLFSGFVFYVGREVPIDIAEFLVLSCGGSVISEAGLDQLENKDGLDLSKVTHQLVDRPNIKNRVPGRTYVQPQWIFDCVNKGSLVPTNSYLPGESLPPHLSPWGDAAGYDPNAAAEEAEDDEDEEGEDEGEEDEGEDEGEGAENVSDKEDEKQVEQDESDEENEDLQAQKELELEAQGVSYTDAKESENSKSNKSRGKKRKAPTEDEEEKKLRMIMMSNKQRKLYKKMQHSNDKRDERVENLKKKKQQIVKAKKAKKSNDK
ncbi:hypothetical protein ZYGR_0AI05450 [Zygosaccharomyces rouxii]|uniref:Pescadillo homolog n=1 Tax=Zygosaccharomyces rouxii TaxID=4956 RepID=A0A1Q3AC99_ZYGRO|nr:hypothetical protein ZYGR_0AI05450 [Zygosaccharomyces rouxii]